ncbi:hypothetical protein BGZ96_001214 [Linnemannia gamsii]|uniref:Fe2OG dioxygenase domain-containing protein n=1 Tax=Linnemannia gamsii TaxID=64522 RepID=A0ABQ7KHM6_9FUNG|nr:hypothetical protein BGZ96_001214 [Linnemannia gamsii]
MNDLEQELFGSSDSDSDLELDMDMNSHQLGNSRDLDDNSAEFDPIFQSIMNSHEENERQPPHLPHPYSLNNPGATFTNALIPTFPITNYNSRTLTPKHVPHEAVEGLCLHTNILSEKEQARLMAQITEKNFFKAGQQNQAMCFGQRDLVWLNWLIHGRLFSDTVEDGEGSEKEEAGGGNGVLSEPFCSSSWTTRIPLFDQSIMNLYFPGNGIKPHVDLARFEDGIIIISLLSAINMDFYKALSPMSPHDPPEGTNTSRPPPLQDQRQQEEREPDFTVRLEPGSVLTIQGKARYEWEHGIRETMEDVVDDGGSGGNETVKRKIRVSITLRKMRGSAWEVGGPGGSSDGTVNGVADR